MEFKHRSLENNPYIWDTVLIDFVQREKNIKVYLNTCIDEVEVDEDGTIVQELGTKIPLKYDGTFQVHGLLTPPVMARLVFWPGPNICLAGKLNLTSTTFAPEVADKYVLPSTLFWRAKDMGHPVRYVAPDLPWTLVNRHPEAPGYPA